MPNPNDIDLDLARGLFTMFPPMIRDSLAESNAFLEKFDFQLDATISFGSSGFAIKRSVLYPTIRQLYANNQAPMQIASREGKPVEIALVRENETLSIRLTDGTRTHFGPSFWFLSPDRQFRQAEFEKEARDQNLPDHVAAEWRSKIAEGPLSDGQVDELHEQFRLTPESVAAAIAGEVRKKDSNVSVLVPRSLEYYERLVGPLKDAGTVQEFLEQTEPAFINQLLSWDFDRGLAQCLLSCAHPSFAQLIPLQARDPKAVENFFLWLEERGDRFSQIAGLEIGIRAIEEHPALEPILIRLIRSIIADDPSEKAGRLSLSANIFIFVDGELSRVGVFRNSPPFYRRLAAIGQAALIERELLDRGIDAEAPADWATSGRGQYFYIQSLADMRREPRWLPDLMTGEQLRFEFLSRIQIAAESIRGSSISAEFGELLYGEHEHSLPQQIELPFSGLPGPLEGGSEAPLVLPPEFFAELKQLDVRKVLQGRAFAGVVNLALVFRVEPEVAALIAQTLRTVKYRLSLGEQDGVSFALLAGLAVVAAVTRSKELADEVRILARVLRRRGEVDDISDNQMRIALISCSAVSELDAWSQAVGEWLTELAYENLTPESARALRSHVRQLCRVQPALWRYCAKADAALASMR